MIRMILAAALPACAWACTDSRQVVDFERMRQQQRGDAYEASAFFADGTVMRVPPPGTVPWDARDVPPVIATGSEDGVPVRDIPIPVTRDTVARGRHYFDIYCAVCHGADASGRSVMAENMPGPRPPSLVSPEVASHAAGHLFAVTSGGKNRMPAYDWALSATERWAVIAYLRTLQPSHAPAHPDHRHEAAPPRESHGR